MQIVINACVVILF